MKKNRLVIRLQKRGRIRRPFYYIIVTNSKKSEKGGFRCKIGYYDPFSIYKKLNMLGIVVNLELLSYWISKGAIPNATVMKLLYK